MVVTAYVFDALGTVVGFLLFYLVALPSGIPVALGAGLLGYAAAWGDPSPSVTKRETRRVFGGAAKGWAHDVAETPRLDQGARISPKTNRRGSYSTTQGGKSAPVAVCCKNIFKFYDLAVR